MAQKGSEFILNTGGWAFRQTIDSLICTNKNENIDILYHIRDYKLTIQSKTPDISLSTPEIEAFTLMKQFLVRKLKEKKVEVTDDIAQRLLTMVPFVLGPINTTEELESELKIAISQNNTRHVTAIFQYYFDQKYGQEAQNHFWFTITGWLFKCLKSDKPWTYDAIDCFKIILLQCQNHITPATGYVRPTDIKKVTYDRFMEAKAASLRSLAYTGSYEDENIAIQLSALLLLENATQAEILNTSRVLRIAVQNNRLQLLEHLLTVYRDHVDVNPFRYSTINLPYNDIFLLIEEVKRKVANTENQKANEIINYIENRLNAEIESYKTDRLKFKKLVDLASQADNTNDSSWNYLIKTIERIDTVPLIIILYIMIDIAPTFIDNNKIQFFNQLFVALHKSISFHQKGIELNKDTLKAAVRLAYNPTLSDEAAANCLRLLFPTKILYLGENNRTIFNPGSILGSLCANHPDILSLCATNGGHGLLKLLLETAKKQNESLLALSKTAGREEFYAAIEKRKFRCAGILLDHYSIFIWPKDLENLKTKDDGSEEYKLLLEKMNSKRYKPQEAPAPRGKSFFGDSKNGNIPPPQPNKSNNGSQSTKDVPPKNGTNPSPQSSQSNNTAPPKSQPDVNTEFLHPTIKQHLNSYGQRSPFKSLGIDPTDDIDFIRAAYKSLSTKLHPNSQKYKSADNEKFKEINSAKEILEDGLLRFECLKYWKIQQDDVSAYSSRL